MTSPVGTYNMLIVQGSDKNISLIVKDDDGTVINLTGYTARMQVRSKVTSDIVLDDLTTENGRISITAVEGKIVLSFPSSTTSNYNFVSGVYDLEIIAAGVVKRLIEGSFSVNKEVTR